MEKSDVTSKVKNVVGEVLKISPSEISNDANFIFDLGANSMQSIQLVGAFEEEFDIELDEDKALEVQSIADAVDFISSYL
ncbi:MAG: acyl carrier protein [Cyclobacteriaceae bacterium]|nr:acyl carrier protein [Cyclobacteriaceae bacterium]MCK5210223.1 acyl carrier protein [Cyclobacteriaceae bacterium]MCK5280677.1 acyl carrier protein [Cyclobacteriaceae bacterium]MCK5367602.1 acyl carrier protein [Cyclobacteriaceae bacterium]